MSKGLICDRCGAVSTEFKSMTQIKASPYNGNLLTVDSKTKHFDLCKDCTETLMQYINNEVDMIIFNDGRAADDQTDNSDPSI